MRALPESLLDKTVAVLGGTGPQGRGLARRFAAAGTPVVSGGRSAERAAETASVLPCDGRGELLKELAPALVGRAVGAFRNVSAVPLEPEVVSVDTDVFVLGDVREATDLGQDLGTTIPGVRGVFGGRLRNAHQVEALTANLISVNRRYQARADVRVTDI